MFESAERPLLSRQRFAARMAGFVLAALIVDAVVLAAGTVGYHFLEELDWLDASLNAALVMTGNGPFQHPRSSGGKLFTVCYALLGAILFATVIGVLLTPVFHRVLHTLHRRHQDPNEKNDDETVEGGEDPLSAGG
jgi:uncharacterized membrane protein